MDYQILVRELSRLLSLLLLCAALCRTLIILMNHFQFFQFFQCDLQNSIFRNSYLLIDIIFIEKSILLYLKS